MPNLDELAAQFELHRPRLRSVAYRMLGMLDEADDAIQEAWLRLQRTDAEKIANLGGWLTTVVSRVCLDALRTRASRREEGLDTARGPHLPDPVISLESGTNPEHEALLAETLGLAIMAMLEELSPPERVAFVLHDVFAVPFREIAPVLQRTPEATRKLASRARIRMHGTPSHPDADQVEQRRVVDAFLGAARNADVAGLLEILDPGVVLRADYGAAPPVAGRLVRGAHEVVNEALAFSRMDAGESVRRPALVNGAVGQVVFRAGQPYSVMGFAIIGGRIVAIDILVDPERLKRLDWSFLGPAV